MKNYIDLMRKVLHEGIAVPDRTGTGTVELFAERLKFDLSDGFPLVTGKATSFKVVAEELRWMLSGSTNTNDLDSTIWDEWRSQYTVPREIVEVEPIEKEYEPYDFDVLGISITGYIPADGQPLTLVDRLAGTWKSMMQRCYDSRIQSYHMYGAKGVSVCKRWHQITNFIEDAQRLPHWRYKSKDWSGFDLDKDYYSSSQYGPETCVWLRQDENMAYTGTAVTAINCYGAATTYLSRSACARALQLDPKVVHRQIEKGTPLERGTHGGWKFEWAKPKTPLRYKLIPEGDLGKVYGHNWRHLESGDQIAELMAGLKSDPHSRRHIVSSWIPESNKTAALHACHALLQCNVANGRVNLHMYQRSADLFLGVAMNIAFYALLTELIAFELGLVAGELTISFGSTHIYMNHIKQVMEYLERDLHPLPKLVVSSSDIVGASFDATLVGYKSGERIRAEVAV